MTGCTFLVDNSVFKQHLQLSLSKEAYDLVSKLNQDDLEHIHPKLRLYKNIHIYPNLIKHLHNPLKKNLIMFLRSKLYKVDRCPPQEINFKVFANDFESQIKLIILIQFYFGI